MIYKEELKEKAERHARVMRETGLPFIMSCAKKSKVYGECGLTPEVPENVSVSTSSDAIEFMNCDTVSALFKLKGTVNDDKIAVLNFASYKNPGGKFLEGSFAQEEMLCHSSYLYNVLVEKNSYYDWNRRNLNYGLYTNRALFSPSVWFKKDGQTCRASVISCAAPNLRAMKYHPDKMYLNDDLLQNRALFVCKVAAAEGCSVIILGAWGCGVFGQQPEDVACAWKMALNEVHFDRVIMAVPGDTKTSDNARVFYKVFG